MSAAGPSSEPSATVRVCSLAGALLAELSPAPPDAAALKVELEARVGCPRALQKLIASGGARIYADDDKLEEEEGLLQLMLVVDESPMATWDIEGNPCKAMLEGEGGLVASPRLRHDYCNVLTKEPVRAGRHYFRFVMHEIGDEQWCGLVSRPDQAGPHFSGRSLRGWVYYCGRMNVNYSSIVDGLGALHAEGRAVKEFKKLQRQGDVIGMLVDMDVGAVAFDLNGELQGACAVPRQPLWVLTHLDTPRDRVELEKPSLADAPPANLDALTGALLDVSQGYRFCGAYRVFDSDEEEDEDADGESESGDGSDEEV